MDWGPRIPSWAIFNSSIREDLGRLDVRAERAGKKLGNLGGIRGTVLPGLKPG